MDLKKRAAFIDLKDSSIKCHGKPRYNIGHFVGHGYLNIHLPAFRELPVQISQYTVKLPESKS